MLRASHAGRRAKNSGGPCCKTSRYLCNTLAVKSRSPGLTCTNLSFAFLANRLICRLESTRVCKTHRALFALPPERWPCVVAADFQFDSYCSGQNKETQVEKAPREYNDTDIIELVNDPGCWSHIRLDEIC